MGSQRICFDHQAKYFMQNSGSLKLVQDGMGGILSNDRLRHLVGDLRQRKISYFHMVNGRNLAAKIGDPFMIGLAASENNELDIVTKFARGKVALFATFSSLDHEKRTRRTNISLLFKWEKSADFEEGGSGGGLGWRTRF